jgi:hypothetical protein
LQPGIEPASNMISSPVAAPTGNVLSSSNYFLDKPYRANRASSRTS